MPAPVTLTITLADGEEFAIPAATANRIVGKDPQMEDSLVADSNGTRFYVTDCCGAPVTISQDDGVTCCKGCWEEAPGVLGAVPPTTNDRLVLVTSCQ